MQPRTSLLMALLASAACGCSEQSASSAKPDPELLALEAKALPPESAHRAFIDFGGKIALVGYELGTTGPVSGGSEIGLTLYWQASAPLEPGWELTTEVLSQRDLLASEAQGALHTGPDSKLGPSAFRIGRLYKDELRIKLPEQLSRAEISIAASVKRSLPPADPALPPLVFRLPVLSGPSDGNNRGIVAHLPATVTTKASADSGQKRRPRRRDSAPSPSAAPSAR